MPVQLVNSHVLLPDYPEWTGGVRRSRTWLTSVERALTGSESREALRPKPRERISFRVESRDPDTLCGLLALVDAALKAGLACCPDWGRGIPMVSATGDTVVLDRNAWVGVQPGSFVYLLNRETLIYEVAEVANAWEDELTLTEDVLFDWSAGGWAWPLLFGRPAFSDIEHRTDWHAGFTVTLSEIVAVPVTPSVPPAPAVAITFDYALSSSACLNPAAPDTVTFDYALGLSPTLNPQN